MKDREPRKEIEPSPKPLIAVIMGSDSDLRVMIDAVDVLAEFEVPYIIDFISAHRTPDLMFEFARNAKGLGLEAIIAGAGGAAHLPGMIASGTRVPVIGVPIAGSRFDGLDALLSQVQMPNGKPVGVMAIDGAANAALYGIQWLANKYPEYDEKLEKYFQKMHDNVMEKRETLKELRSHEYLKWMQEQKGQ